MREFIHKWLRIPHTLHVGIDENPKKPLATVVLIHGIANSHAMWSEIAKKIANENIRVISIDLLGFGSSPKPAWQTYSATVHARSLRLTLLKLRVQSPVILVGHSLGALVAIQYAKRYKRGAQSLLLCNPPFYKASTFSKDVRIAYPSYKDDAYHLLYRNSRYRADIAKRLAIFMKSAKLLSRHFTVSEETMPAIISSLEMSIENQTSLEDAKKLTLPIKILCGQFDPLVLKSHIRELETANTNVSVARIPVGHQIIGPIYKNAIVKHINEIIKGIAKKPLPKSLRL